MWAPVPLHSRYIDWRDRVVRVSYNPILFLRGGYRACPENGPARSPSASAQRHICANLTAVCWRIASTNAHSQIHQRWLSPCCVGPVVGVKAMHDHPNPVTATMAVLALVP